MKQRSSRPLLTVCMSVCVWCVRETECEPDCVGICDEKERSRVVWECIVYLLNFKREREREREVSSSTYPGLSCRYNSYHVNSVLIQY